MTWRLTPTLVVLALAVLGVILVEVGMRPAPARVAAEVPTPQLADGWLDRFRSMPKDAIARDDLAALVGGIALGRDDGLEESDREVFRVSGLAHLVAASGQNIALIIILVRVLVWLVGGGPRLCALGAAFAVPAYVMVVGGGPSIIRAGLVAELGLLAWAVGRLPNARHATAMAACVTIWIWPGIHRDLGWQLSFACVAGLSVLATAWADELKDLGIPGPLAIAVGASAACSVVTAPILVIRVGSAPALASLANLVAVPLAAVVLFVGLIGCILGLWLPLAGAALLNAASVPSWVILSVARLSVQVPGAATSSTVFICGLCVVGAVVERYRRRHPGYVLLAAGALLCAAPVAQGAWADVRAHEPTEPTIAVLDVGQGHATVVGSRGGGWMLVDSGPPGGAAQRALRALGIGELSVIAMTHGSLDHRGGVSDVLQRTRTPRFVMPTSAPQLLQQYVPEVGRQAQTDLLCEGDRLDLGSARAVVLTPSCDGSLRHLTGDDENDNALSFLFSIGSGRSSLRALVPSDVEASVLLTSPTLRRDIGAHGSIDVLVVSHHGSADSQLPQLLTLTRPRLAVVPVGADNSYGHPHPDTLTALSDAHVRVLRSDQDGTVVVSSRSVIRHA